MFTDVATSILRKAEPAFRFGRDDLDPARAKCIELPVWLNGRCIGHLEHDEMPDRRPVIECFGRYGVAWTEERKILGYRPYKRDCWQSCFREIIGQVSRKVQARIRKYLRRAGYRL